MGKKKRISFVVLVLSVLSFLAWEVFRGREPVYQGKTLTEWLEVYNTGGQTETNYAKTREAVEHVGTNAIPTLLRMLRKTDSRLKMKWYEFVYWQRVFKIKVIYASWRNQEAAMGFRILGGRARAAVPGLIKIYEENISPTSASYAAEALGAIGRDAKAAVPSLLSVLNSVKDPNDPRRAASVKALGEIGEEPAQVVPVLIGCLRDSNTWVQTWALGALESFGPAAKSAVPKLNELLDDSSIGTRFAARRALWKIDPEAAAKTGVK